jgi:hypothetical protein
VYAIPVTNVRITSGAVVQYSILFGGAFANIASGDQVKGGFIKCVTGGTTIKLDRVKMKKSVYFNQVISDGAIFYWKLDETIGLVAKDSVGGKDGTIAGGALLGQAGPNGNAMYFDGVDDVITGPAIGNLGGEVTLECWLRFIPIIEGVHRYIIAFGTPNATPVHVVELNYYADGNSMASTFCNSSGASGSGTFPPPSDNAWHQFIIAYSAIAGRTYSYLDAVKVTDDPVPVGTFNITTGFFIGGFPPGNRYKGFIDNIALYNKVLTPGQISDHYNAGR